MKKTLFKRAQTLQHEGKLDDALILYDDLLKESPKEPELLHSVGILYAQKGEYEKSAEFISRAIKENPDVALFHNNLGNVLLRLEKLKQAGKEYYKAIKLNPQYAMGYNNLGNTLYRRNKLNAAKLAYQKAIALSPQYKDAHYNLAILYAKLGEKDNAIDELKKTLELSPKHAAAFGQLGEVYLTHGDYEKAIENFKARLELQPNHDETWHSIGLAYLNSNHFPEAIEAFDNTLALEPVHPEAHHNLASAYVKYGDYEKALNHYLQQILTKPKMESYYNIGVLLMNQNRYRESTEYLEQAAVLEPDYLPIHINLGAIYLKINRMNEAIKHYKIAAKLNPNDPEIEYILDAITQQKTPEAAPAEYLQHLFDQYADYYDQHLTKYLSYQVPQKLFHAVFEETGVETPEWIILDLGCGTGLCGEYFRRVAKQLIGIDISERMIETAKNKDIYDDLKVANIQQALDEYSNIDLVIAADVFTYIGDLSSIFAKVKNALNPNGMFAFSVEKTHTEPYILTSSARYAHSKKYLDQLIKQQDYETVRFDNIVMRKQQNQSVEGYLVILRKIESR